MYTSPIICDLLIENCYIVTPFFTLSENASIAIAGNRIIDIGSGEVFSAKYQPKQRLNGTDKLAMPGMYDCHTHTVQQLLKGAVIDEPPIIWRRILVPYESTMTTEDRYHAARLYCIQALKAGITMFADAGSMDMEGTIQAVKETGIRASIARVGRIRDSELPENMCDPDAKTAVRQMEALYQAHHGDANGRIHIWFSLSSVMSANEELARSVAEASKEYHTGVHIHLAEHPAEVQLCLRNWKMRPPQFLDFCGLLGAEFDSRTLYPIVRL